MKNNCGYRISVLQMGLILLLLLLPSLSIPMVAEDSDTPAAKRRILVMHSSLIDKTCETDVAGSFMRTMTMLTPSAKPFAYYQLELHADTLPEANFEAVLLPFMSSLKAGKFAAVVTIGNAAAQIIRQHLNEIADSTFVYSMAEIQSNSHDHSVDNAMKLAMRKTCELASRLFPDRRTLVVLTDKSEYNQQTLRKIIDSTMPDYKTKVFFCCETKSDAVIDFLRENTDDAIVIIHRWRCGRNNNDETDIISKLSVAVRVPIFVLRRSLVKLGAIGGVVISGHDVGVAAATEVFAALSGQNSDVGDKNVIQPHTVLDWNVLSAFKVSENRIPETAIVENRPLNFWQLHLYEVLVVVCAIFFLLAITLFVVILRMRGHYKKSEEYSKKLRCALEAAHAAERVKTDFLSTMSHEIRTPLNTVIGFSELLRDGSLPPDERFDYLEAIQFSSNALLELINDILDLAKLDAGRLKIKNSNTDLHELFHEIKTIFCQQSKGKQIEFIVSLPPDTPMVLTDPVRLRQIILNLVGNAFKFTEHGTIELCGKYVPSPTGSGVGELTLQVRDTGIGMKPDFLAKLFQPFTQANDSNSSAKQTGTGLGLRISQRLAKAMNGELRAESVYGKGSCFTLKLSNVAAAPKTVVHAKDHKSELLTDLKYSILIVDDQQLNLTVLDRMLRKFGLDPVTATSARKALKQFERKSFDIVMTDLKMPKMSGCELAAAIRKLPQGKTTKIFVVTADIYADTGCNLDAFNAVLTKPLTLEKLNSLFIALNHNNAAGDGMLLNELCNNNDGTEK